VSDFIDMSPHVDAVQSKYPDYYRNAQAHIEMADLWGGVTCNHCGVIEPTERLHIELPSHARWNASIWLVAAPNGRWLMSTGYHYPSGGGSGPVSVWNRRAYTSRDAAIAAGVQVLGERFKGIRDWPSSTNGEKLLAERMIEHLTTYTTKPKQMNLF